MSSIIRTWETGLSTSPRTSRYDCLHAGLVATILVVGFIVVALLTVWICGDLDRPNPSVPLVPTPNESSEDNGGGEEVDLDTVAGSSNSELESAFEVIEEAVSHKVAAHGDPNGGVITGIGIRDPGPPRVLSDSPMKRWKIRYETSNRDQYKQQLDYFGIEIGVLHSRRNDVWRVGELSTKGGVVVHSNREDEGDSAWFSHSNRRLRGWDREIAQGAGVAVEETLSVQFFPQSLMAQIQKLEAEKLEELGRELSEVRKTLVTLQPSGEQFSISISAFEFR